MDWKFPDHLIVPLGSGALLDATFKAINELKEIGIVEGELPRISGTQPSGCSPIINAINSDSDTIIPIIDPKTIVKSLAIGDPASGYHAIDAIESTGGWGDNPSDSEIIEAQLLLAREEGIFVEPTGGCVVASLKRKIESGEIHEDEVVVLYLTGSGLKTVDTLTPYLGGVKSSEAEIEDVFAVLEVN